MCVRGSIGDNLSRVAPVENPCSVRGELELEIGVGINLFVGDLVDVRRNHFHSVGLVVYAPVDSVEEVAVAVADSGNVIDLVCGLGNACTCYGDSLCGRVVGYGNVAV